MGTVAFFDLKADELAVYTFGKNGHAGSSGGPVSIPVGEGYSFAIQGPHGDAEESFLSLPLSMLNFRVIELPFSDIKKIRDLLPFEMESLILGGTGRIVFDAFILGEDNGKYRVLVAYIAKKLLSSLLDRLKEAGYDPKAVVSVELAHAVHSPAARERIPEIILSPEPITEKERMAAAEKELRNPTINLRQDEFAYTADTEKTKRSLRTTAFLFLALLLVSLSYMSWTIISVTRENSALRSDIRKVYTGLFPNEKKITGEGYQLRAHIRELKEKESSLVGISPLQLLLDLSRISRPGMAFSEVVADNELIILKGECASLSDAQKIKNDLEEFLRDVSISDTRPSPQNRTGFTIAAKGRKT